MTAIETPATATFLVVGPDPKLRRESEAALAGVADAHAVIHHVNDYRRGVEAARSRHPALVLVEMTGDFRALRAFAEEIAAASPGTAVVAVFAPSVFGPDVSESAVIIEAIRAGIQDFLRRPMSSADLGQLIDRLVRRSVRTARPLGKTIFFVGNKGGGGQVDDRRECGVRPGGQASRPGPPGRCLAPDGGLRHDARPEAGGHH